MCSDVSEQEYAWSYTQSLEQSEHGRVARLLVRTEPSSDNLYSQMFPYRTEKHIGIVKSLILTDGRQHYWQGDFELTVKMSF